MQCPACTADSPVVAYGDPLRCPECGAFYEKAVQAAATKSRPISQNKANEVKEPRAVVVVDIDMSFTALVNFMVKLAVASIPAFLVLLAITIGVLLFTGMLGHLVR